MFVRAANPIWFMVDLVGQPLNDEYYAFFLENTFPYNPQNVYRDPQGMTVWTGNVLQFYPNGTLPDNLYFNPNLVYRIEIRQGNLQSDPLIYEINDFVPGDGETSQSVLPILGNENQITNPFFSLIDFVSPLTITTAGTHNIAPGWDLVLTGAGSTVITRLILQGNQFPPNPTPFPYSLQFANNGWSSALLVQRFRNNGAIFSNGAIAGSISGRAIGTARPISMNYIPSNTVLPGMPTPIFVATLQTGNYQNISKAVNVNRTGNAQLSTVAFVDIQLILPPTGTVELTNIQIIGQSNPLPVGFDPNTPIPFQQETNERVEDHTFHVFKNEFTIKPQKSVLTGWNFPLNPFQFSPVALTAAAAQTQYIADQTILHQEAAGAIETGKNVVAQRQNLLLTPVTLAASTRFALIQYIDPATIRPYWSYVMSALARLRLSSAVGTSIRLKCRLIYRSTLPATIGAAEPIAAWAANSDPTFSAGWTALAPKNDPAYVIPNSFATGEGTNAYPTFSFDQFILPTATSADMTLGIVLYTMDNMRSALTKDQIWVDKVSLIPSLFAADAYPQTFNETLQDCQFYYETSYPLGEIPGVSIVTTGMKLGVTPLRNDAQERLIRKSFEVDFQTDKRAVLTVGVTSPGVIFYRPGTSTADTIELEILLPGAGAPIVAAPTTVTGFYSSTVTKKNVLLAPSDPAPLGSTAPVIGYEARTLYHYVADARLGL